MTDNLNFGNPYKPENFWQLREAVEGLSETCRAFGTPVVGGNVSLYNESPAGVVDPTPTVAMVGLIEDERHITTQFFKNAGDVIILVGEIGNEMGATHFLKVCHGRKEGLPPRLDIARELAVQNSVRELIRAGLVKSAHDCSEGGLAVALAECCFNPERLFGANVDISNTKMLGDEKEQSRDILFNESQSRVILSVDPGDVEKIYAELGSQSVPFMKLGSVEIGDLFITSNGLEFRWPVATLHDDWFYSIERSLAVE